jgi:hypothetical protein
MLLVFGLMIALATISVNHKNQETEQEKEPTIFVNPQQVFKPTEKLSFILDLGQNPKLSAKYQSLMEKVYAEGQQDTQTNTYRDENVTISANLVSTVSKKPLDIPLEISKENETRFQITGNNEDYQLIPGKYDLNVEVQKGEEKLSFQQDFTWGVLALNTNKSIYTPGEAAQISMAVLDEDGKMVCNADVVLEIKDPQENVTQLTTKDGQIIVNKNCQKKEFIEEPDFETVYQVGAPGNYEMKLTSVTKNGSYTISDSFQVNEKVPFDLERKTATRIYPPIEYPVNIVIIANEDFNGTITERVPSDFEIVASSKSIIKNTSEAPTLDPVIKPRKAQLVQATYYYQEPGNHKIISTNSYQEVSWQVKLKKDEQYQITYKYKAPEISPEFYLLGPITFTNSQGEQVFQEARQWQIASDAINYVTNNVNATNNGSSISPSLAVAANDLVIFFCMTSANKTLTLSSGTGWTSVLNQSGTPSGASWYKISTGATENPTCSWSGNTFAAGILVEYSGVDTTYPFDGSNSSTGSDSTVECGSVTSNDGTDVYVVGLSINSGASSISTWSNNFNERVDQDNGGGKPSQRQQYGVADKVASGSQSTTATVGTSGAWRCHTLAFNQEFDRFQGRVFTDDDEASTLTGQSTCAVINSGTPSCVNTDSSGYFTIDALDGTGGDQLTFFLDGGTNLGNTVTLSNGADVASGDNLKIYQNHVIVRHEQGTGLSIADMDAYDNDQNPTDMLFDAETGPNTLTVEDPNELFVQSGYTFAPNGNLTAAHDIQIDGVWTSGASETVNLSGSYDLNIGGTLNPSTSTVTFDGTAGTENLFTDGTGGFYNLVVDDSSGSLTLDVQDPLTVYNDLTITGGNLDVVSGENNQITVGGSWNNDDVFTPQNGTVLFNGSGATTYTIDAEGTSSPDFYNITMNDSGGGATYQLTTPADVNGSLTVTSGTFDSNGNDITVGGNWTNSGTFIEGTNTVTFDGAAAATLNSGCANEATCTNENFYNLTINKDEDSTVTLSSTHLRVTNLINVVTGWLIQGAQNIRAEGSTAIDIDDFGRWQNLSTGNVTLGGNVINDGNITLNANGLSCGDADSITISSTDGTQRTWSGLGGFRMGDLTVSDESGSAVIHVADGTNNGNNGSNWSFVECSIFEFNGLNFQGINLD